LFLLDTIWLTFLHCLFITKLVMKYIWVTHTELTVGKLVWFLDCSSIILVISVSLNYFCRLNSFNLFQSLSATRKCEPISIFIYYFRVHLVFTVIYAHYRELMSWSRAISSLLQACFLLGLSFLETKICFLTLGEWYCWVQVDFARSYNIQVACTSISSSWKHVKNSLA
jgi:hypothetical protein